LAHRAWLLVLAICYPLCRWFAGVKERRSELSLSPPALRSRAEMKNPRRVLHELGVTGQRQVSRGTKAMKRIWTIIGVRDVPLSFRWYQSLFGQRATAPRHPYFGQILDSDGTVLLCLHEWTVEDHPSLRSPEAGTPGNGLLLFFRVDDYGRALRRARALVRRIEEEPHLNPNTGTKEFSLRDPDGYYVTMSALSATEL